MNTARKSGRVVFDTNVWVSAFLFGGKLRSLSELARKRGYRFYISRELIEEFEDVLERKLRRPPEEVARVLERLDQMTLKVLPATGTIRELADDADNRVLECALAARANSIVSGDKHLLLLKEFRGIPILTPTRFLKRLSNPKPKI